MKTKPAGLLVNLFFLAFAIALFVASFSIDVGAKLSMGGDYMPKLCSVLLMLLSAGLLVKNLFGMRRQDGGEARQAEERSADTKKFLLELALLVGYALAFKPIGFLLSTAAYVTLQICLFAPERGRKIWIYALIGVVCSAVVYLVFVYGFQFLLPGGILG